MKKDKIPKEILPILRAFLEPAVQSGILERPMVQRIVAACGELNEKVEYATVGMLTTREAAARLGTCPKTVLRMGQTGQLTQTYLTGSRKSLRWRAAEIEALCGEEQGQDATDDR